MVDEVETNEVVSSVDGFKQRIVGAVVLVCAAIVLLPMIFDEPHLKTQNKIIPIPVAPARPVIQIDTPVAPKFQVFEIGNKVAPAENTYVIDRAIADDELLATDEPVGAVPKENGADVNKAGAKFTNKPTPQEAPSVETLTSKNKQPTAAVSSDSQKRTVAVAATQQKILDTPKVSDQPIFKNVWMVRLGVFGKDSNAYQLRDKVRTLGFSSHTRKITRDNRVLIAVYAGPYISEREAKARKQQLDKALGKEKIVGIVQNIASF